MSASPADAGRDPGFVEHYGTGGGYWNAMRVYPALDLAMVAMANTTASWDFDQLFTGLSELDWSC
jgi:CubicO group peptidase (beta-lactamase class C family)